MPIRSRLATPRRFFILATAIVTGVVSISWASQVRREPVVRHVRDQASAFPDRVVLTWSDDPATTQSVTWRTDTTVASAQAQVAIATDGPALGDSAVSIVAKTSTLRADSVTHAELTVNYHSATFTGLLPNTKYGYRVGDGEHWSEWFHFATANDRPEPFSFLYLGDVQNDILSLWSRVIREGFRTAPDVRFIIHAGDLVNQANHDGEWSEWFGGGGFIHAMVPSVPAAGNHEYAPRNADEREQREKHLSVFWREQFTLPENGVSALAESNYWFDYQGVRVLVLDSNREQEAQARWMRRVLRSNPQRWTIATFHHPIFSAAVERDNPKLRALWKPVFDELGVDLVLQGHDHTYARGRVPERLQAADGTVGSAIHNVQDGMNTLDQQSGTVYVVSVSGGKMYESAPDGWTPYEAVLERKAENTQLFQVIHVSGDTLSYRAHTATGALYDAFELQKAGAGRRNRFVETMPRVGAASPRAMR